MKPNRTGAAALGLLAASAMLLSACGSDNNTSSSGSSAGSSAADCAGKKTLKASGSSAQKNAMERFQTAYEAACSGYTLNYNPSGSGAGIKDFAGNLTDFAGSDSALNKDKGEVDAAAKRCGSPAWNLPTVFGPIAVAYNLAGVDKLALDGKTLGAIFTGKITTWNAPEIAALNPGVTLPGDKINVVFRSDESGTSENFQKYLKAASDGTFDKEPAKTFNGGVGEGAKGSDGVTGAVKAAPGTITYAEWSFAKKAGVGIASIITSAGPDPVVLSLDSSAKSIESVKVKGEGNDLVLDTASFYKPTATGAYPIMLATYEIVCSKYADADTGKAVKSFLNVAIGAGQKGLDDGGYVPVPDTFKAKLADAIKAIS